MPNTTQPTIRRRSEFDGYQMMADDTQAGADGQQPPIPTPADLAAQIAAAMQAKPGEQKPADDPKPADGDGDKQDDPDYRGAGGKAKLQADLAEERDKRQQLEQQVNTMRDGFAKALGLDNAQAQQVTPEQLTEQLTSSRAENDTLRTQLAVFLNAPADVDAKALLDSRSFTDSLAGIKPDDAAGIAAKVAAAVETNPRLKVRHGSNGDLYQGRDTYRPEPAPGVPALRDAVERELSARK